MRRDGLVEAVHPVSAIAVDASGRMLDRLGDDPDRPFFGRSTFKPFQAVVAQRHGAGLAPEQLAVASASHRGQPAHVALVRGMLAERGLAEADLRCPPARPGNPSADRRLAAAGDVEHRPVFHNCSGKHAAMLRAARNEGWSAGYLEADHPLQRHVVALTAEMTGRAVTPTGTDGCGVPTMRTDIVSLSRGYARLVTDPETAGVADAMARFAALTADGDRPEAELARWLPAVVKGGAEGCIAAGWMDGGVGFAAKAWSGDATAAVIALVGCMRRVGIVPDHLQVRLREVASPPVWGAGRPVGHYVLVGP